MTDDERLAAYEQCVRERYGPSSRAGAGFLVAIFTGDWGGAVTAWVNMILHAPQGDDTCARFLTEEQKAKLAAAVQQERNNRAMEHYDDMPR